MKRLFTRAMFALALAIPCFSQAQNAVVDHLVTKLKNYSANHAPEKAYLQFDKPYYASGDTIYFKAYVTSGEKHQLSNISGILHVDLVSPADHVYQSRTLQLANGITWGDFEIPDSLTKGNYRIRAYTHYMQNDKEGIFDQVIPISSPKMATVYENNVPQEKIQVADLQFFPEGGNMVANIRARIGFKAIGVDGLGTAVKGFVVDNTNKTVATFASTNRGMGSFYLSAEEGKTYRAKYKMKDSVLQTVDLPKPITKGVVLSVNPQLDKVSVQIDVNHVFYTENENKEIILTIYSGGQLTHVISKLDSWELSLNLPVQKFSTGIAKFTVFSANGEPLAERLAFVQNPLDYVDLGLSTDKTIYNKREKVAVSISQKASGTDAGKGHYSVAVIDEGKVPTANYHNSILSYLLLTSELKGYVEQPDYYFDSNNAKAQNDLDLLMLTQGYRRFTWAQVLNDSLPGNEFKPEKAISISGRVTSLNGKKPIANGTVNLITPNRGPVLTQQTDSMGRFNFSGLLFLDSTKLVLSATTAKGDKNTLIIVDKPEKLVNAPGLHVPGNAVEDMQTYVQNVKLRQAENAPYKPMGGKLLKEVQVNALRSSNIIGSGHADQVIDMTKIASGGTMEEVLTGRLRGISLLNGLAHLQGFNRGLMTVIIDGYIPPESAITDLNTINPADVETVEVLKYASSSIYGVQGANGVLIITTKQGTGRAGSKESFGVLPFKATGFYPGREFYAPKYDVASNNRRPDLRSTIYWQPELLTDEKGNAAFSYYNADGTGNYKIIIEGVDEEGHIGRAVYRYAVK